MLLDWLDAFNCDSRIRINLLGLRKLLNGPPARGAAAPPIAWHLMSPAAHNLRTNYVQPAPGVLLFSHLDAIGRKNREFYLPQSLFMEDGESDRGNGFHAPHVESSSRNNTRLIPRCNTLRYNQVNNVPTAMVCTYVKI